MYRMCTTWASVVYSSGCVPQHEGPVLLHSAHSQGVHVTMYVIVGLRHAVCALHYLAGHRACEHLHEPKGVQCLKRECPALHSVWCTVCMNFVLRAVLQISCYDFRVTSQCIQSSACMPQSRTCCVGDCGTYVHRSPDRTVRGCHLLHGQVCLQCW